LSDFGRILVHLLRRLLYRDSCLLYRDICVSIPTTSNPVVSLFQKPFVILKKQIMADTSLKDKLITKIKEMDDPAILEEVSRLFELQEPESVYHVNKEQKKAIDEAKKQIKNNETLPDEQADKDIDEWLN